MVSRMRLGQWMLITNTVHCRIQTHATPHVRTFAMDCLIYPTWSPIINKLVICCPLHPPPLPPYIGIFIGNDSAFRTAFHSHHAHDAPVCRVSTTGVGEFHMDVTLPVFGLGYVRPVAFIGWRFHMMKCCYLWDGVSQAWSTVQGPL